MNHTKRWPGPGSSPGESSWGEGPTYGIPDPQRSQPDGVCPGCGGELWRGDRVYEVDGRQLCRGCLRLWVLELLEVSPGLLALQLGAEAGRFDPGERTGGL